MALLFFSCSPRSALPGAEAKVSPLQAQPFAFAINVRLLICGEHQEILLQTQGRSPLTLITYWKVTS